MTSTFKGDTAELNGNVFECFAEQGDRRQYQKTTEALVGYAKKTLKYYEDFMPIFGAEMKEPEVAKPAILKKDSSELEIEIQKEEIKEYVKRVRVLKSNMGTMYAIMWGQCSEDMKNKVKAVADYHEKTEANDCVWLLKKVRGISMKFDEKCNAFLSALNARHSFLTCQQKSWQPNVEYRDELKGWADTIEYYGGSVAECHHLVPTERPDGTVMNLATRKALACDLTLGVAYIRGADTDRFGILITEMGNNYALGRDEYPKDLQSAFMVLESYNLPVLTRARNSGTANPRGGGTTAATTTSPEASAMTFAQRGAPVAGLNGLTHPGITCYNCNTMGHCSTECPNGRNETEPATGTTLVQYAYMLAQASAGLDRNWILLDSQSTI